MKAKMMIMAAMMIMMTSAADAQTEKKLTNFNDTTFTLNEVTVKSSLPKSRVKGDAMRTIVNGTILEKAGKATDVLNRIPQLKADKDGGVEVFGRGGAEVYINGRKVQDMKELTRISSEQIKSVDVVQNPGARYAASVKAVVRARDSVSGRILALNISMVRPSATTSTSTTVWVGSTSRVRSGVAHTTVISHIRKMT